MKKLCFTLIIMVFGATSLLFAQEKNSKTMIQERIAYMKDHVQLSSNEAQRFWVVYEQYLNEEMKVMDNYRRNLEKQGIKLGAPGTNKEIIAALSDKQISYLQDQKFELRKALLNLETTYYKKYKSILSPRHIQALYNVEYNYKKSMTDKKKEVKKETKKTESSTPVNSGKKIR